MAVKKSKESTEVSRFVYIGPNLSREGLRSYQVYKGDMNDKIQSLKQQYPLIGLLFVKITDMDEAKKRLNTKGTSEYLAGEQIKKRGVKDGV